jgi:hypothetical protein
MGEIKDSIKEVEDFLRKPVIVNEGTITVCRTDARQRRAIHLFLKPFEGRIEGRTGGSLFSFSPDEWVRVLEVMREYFKQEKKLN